MKRKIVILILLSIASSNDVHAIETIYYYDGEHEPNLSLGGKLASEYSNSLLTMTLAGHSNTSKYKAVGYIQNNYSLNGGRMMGTGTVIDCHTILTNAHVIDNQYNKATKPSAVRFMMNRDGSYVPFNFAIKQIRKIKGSDLALLYTYKDMSQYVKP